MIDQEQVRLALREHAYRTGGLMVGDKIPVGTYTVEITGTVEGKLQLRFRDAQQS